METKRAALAASNSAEENAWLAALLAPQPESARQRRWAGFVGRYERLITSCVLKVLRRYGAAFSSDDLDDLVAEVWLTLLRDDLRKLRQYDPGRGVRLASFIGLVASHTAIDHLRSRRAELSLRERASEEVGSVAVGGLTDPLEEDERVTLARRALERLSAEERS